MCCFREWSILFLYLSCINLLNIYKVGRTRLQNRFDLWVDVGSKSKDSLRVVAGWSEIAFATGQMWLNSHVISRLSILAPGQWLLLAAN